MIRHLSATTHFLGGAAQKLCTAVAELCRTLTNDQSGGYRPELHFASTGLAHLRTELGECLAIKDTTARLACYDEIANRPPPHPAKGANAPLEAFGAKPGG